MGCSSSCRHHLQQLLHIHHRGLRVREASCDCRTEEGHTWEGGRENSDENFKFSCYFYYPQCNCHFGTCNNKQIDTVASLTALANQKRRHERSLLNKQNFCARLKLIHSYSTAQGNTVVHSNDKECLMTCLSKAAVITKRAFCCQETFC